MPLTKVDKTELLQEYEQGLAASPHAFLLGYQGIKVTFHVEGDADAETLRGIVEQSRRRSAVYDVLTNPTPVSVEVVAG